MRSCVFEPRNRFTNIRTLPNQIDNQLPKAESRVILGPTPVQTPQPLLQFALERNKHKHHADLYSLQYVFVLLQVRGTTAKEAKPYLYIMWSCGSSRATTGTS